MFFVAVALALCQNPSDPPDVWAKAISAQIEAHEFEDALERAALALEYWPDDGALLDLASLAALENGEKDVALWYASLALAALAPNGEANGKEPPPKLAELERRMAELDPLGGRGRALVAEYRDTLLAVGRSVSKRKLYVNGVDLLSKSRDLGLATAAEAELAKIYDNKKAVEALLDSGLDVPLKSKKKRKKPEVIAKEDAKHAEWDSAWEIKGDNYTIKTDMGQELAESMSLAMEQMNRFYRTVFKVKERGGNTARVTISVYKTRAEFDQHEDEPAPTVMGFFVPGANRVCTFDPREYGYALSELWSTLFHEASHQFTHLISADLIPGWLNEGTASYFEGARLRSNGSVETNLIPEERLVYLELSLNEGRPSLKDVLSYHQPGSYDGSYYPFGWGLVYFLLNYEDQACERVYVPIYQAYMGSYDSGGKHDAFERFVEYFVTKAKQPGIDDFEAFEARWKKWIHELHALHFGPASKADELVARARKQVAAKKLDAAVESYRWALRKRPGDALAYLELAEVLATQKAEDGALFNYRRALTAARAAADADEPLWGAGSLTAAQVIERATAQITKLDREFGAACSAADGKLLAGCVESANAYVEQELPLAALSVLDAARDACGGSAETTALRAKIADRAGADTARWRRPPVREVLEGWSADEEWKADGAALSCAAGDPSYALWRGELPERYTVEVTLRLEQFDDNGFLALVFGAGEGALQYFGVDSRGLVEVGRQTKEWKPLEQLGLVPPKKLEKLRFTIEVAPEKVAFFLDDRPMHARVYSPDELHGGIGLVVQNAKARFEDLRVRY